MKLIAVWNKVDVAKYKDGWRGLAGKLELYMKARVMKGGAVIESNKTDVKEQVGKGTYETGYTIIECNELPENFSLELELWEQDHEPTPEEICDSVTCYDGENPVMTTDQMHMMQGNMTPNSSFMDFGKLVTFVANNLNQDDLYGRWLFTFKKSGEKTWNVELSSEKGASGELGGSVVTLNEAWTPARMQFKNKNNDVNVDISLTVLDE